MHHCASAAGIYPCDIAVDLVNLSTNLVTKTSMRFVGTDE
jgi:hypothetical protein